MRIESDLLANAIPKKELPADVKELTPTNSPFVKIKKEAGFIIDMQYVKLGMKNAEENAYLRKEAYEKLLEAQKLLPSGYRFKILDAWRPFALQEELFYAYRIKIIEEFSLHNLPEEEQDQFVKRFVSLPKNNPLLPPVHTTGGAIDLTIVDNNGYELPMGTAFDEFTDKTNTDYFEKYLLDLEHSEPLIFDNDTLLKISKNKLFSTLSQKEKNIQIAFNRRLLYNIMTKVGFTNLPSEWWHYDYYDRFYAFYNHTTSYYEGIFTKAEFENNILND